MGVIEKIKQNKAAVILASIVLVVGIFLVFRTSNLTNNSVENVISPTVTQAPVEQVEPGLDPLNSSYIIDDQVITLVDGLSEEQIPNSSTVITTRNFNQPIISDLNGIPNEPEDATFLLVHEPGGSGTFYYVVASISSEAGYYGTNGILIGDRIAPQTQEVLEDGTIIVNYADRAEGTSMAEPPDLGMSRYFKIEGRDLVEVDKPTFE